MEFFTDMSDSQNNFESLPVEAYFEIPKTNRNEGSNDQTLEGPCDQHLTTNQVQLHPTLTHEVVQATPLASSTPDCSLEDFFDGLEDIVETFKHQLVPQVEDKKTMKRKRSKTTRVYMGDPINFELSEEEMDYLSDMEGLATLGVEHQANIDNGSVSHLTLTERLIGWSLERRMRDDGRFDTYYHHENLKQKLRSYLEVGDFIISGRLPSKNKKQRTVLIEGTLSKDWAQNPYEAGKSQKMEEKIHSSCKQFLQEALSQIPNVCDEAKNEHVEGICLPSMDLQEPSCKAIVKFQDGYDEENLRGLDGEGTSGSSHSHQEGILANSYNDLILDIPVATNFNDLNEFLTNNKIEKV